MHRKPHALGAICTSLSAMCLACDASHGRRWCLLPPLVGFAGQHGVRIFSLTSSTWDMATAPVWKRVRCTRQMGTLWPASNTGYSRAATVHRTVGLKDVYKRCRMFEEKL